MDVLLLGMAAIASDGGTMLAGVRGGVACHLAGSVFIIARRRDTATEGDRSFLLVGGVAGMVLTLLVAAGLAAVLAHLRQHKLIQFLMTVG